MHLVDLSSARVELMIKGRTRSRLRHKIFIYLCFYHTCAHYYYISCMHLYVEYKSYRKTNEILSDFQYEAHISVVHSPSEQTF